MDERSKRKLEETSTAVLGLFYVICTIEMIIKIIITGDGLSVLGEIIILFSVIVTFFIVQRFDRSYSPALPRKNNGEELIAAETTKARIKRFLIYLKEAVIFALGITIFGIIMDCIIKKQGIIWNLDFFINQLAKIILDSIVFFIGDAIYKEHKIKKYNKWNKKLDE